MTRYELTPDVVDAIAFCTKNPAPMLKYMDILKPFGQYWFVTITSYGREIEPNVPDKEKVMEDFITLSKTLGINCVGWRYDPIFIADKYSIDGKRHRRIRHLRLAWRCDYERKIIVSDKISAQ